MEIMSSKKDLVGSNLGKYRIVEEVGRGGMATVYKAVERDQGQEVAIKVLSPYVAQEPKFKARFDQEIQLLRALDHPNIVPVLDHGEIGEYSFIVMPFLTAGTLRQRLLQGPLPLKAAADIVHQISLGLDYAHELGVVHRDLKPSNIMISDEGQALLTDFGFARVADKSLSLTGSALIGTPAYMSPEQCRGEEATPISDQYALGVILYQMATGELPYEAETPMGVVIMHATEPIPPPREVAPELPEAVEDVILKALEKDPEDRFPSLTAFDEAVQYAVTGRRPDSDGSTGHGWLDQPTQVLESFATKLTKRYLRLRNSLKKQPATIFLILVSLVAILWGILGWSGNGSGAENSTQVPGMELTETAQAAQYLATIDALSTANAPLPGTMLAPGEFETAVAGTLEAFEATSESIRKSETPTPSGTPTPTATPTPTTTEDYYYPSPTATRRSSTPVPPPDTPSAPTPIPPDKCKPPGHPVFGCTETPSP
jgi:serine/threonine-protein kinase